MLREPVDMRIIRLSRGSMFHAPRGGGGREPSTTGRPFPCPSADSLCVCVCVCVWMFVGKCLCVHACVVCLGHMVMFNSPHIWTGNNTSVPHKTDHNLSSLVSSGININDVVSSDPSLTFHLYNQLAALDVSP